MTLTRTWRAPLTGVCVAFFLSRSVSVRLCQRMLAVAPEIIELSGATPKSDIWSVGCTVVELITGEPPYFDLGMVWGI